MEETFTIHFPIHDGRPVPQVGSDGRREGDVEEPEQERPETLRGLFSNIARDVRAYKNRRKQ